VMTEPAAPRPIDGNRRGQPQPGGPSSALIWGAALALAALIVYVSQGLVLLLILSGGLAYLLSPIIRRAQSLTIRREVAASFLFAALVAGLVVAAYALAPRLRAEITTLSAGAPHFAERLDEALDLLQREIAEAVPAAHRVLPPREARYERLNAFIDEQAGNLPGLVGHVATIVVAIVLVPFFAFFLLRDSPKLIRLVMDRLPADYVETSVALWCEIDRVIGRYLRGIALQGVAIGAVAALGLSLLGINYPLLLGAFTGLANIVPVFGPILGGAAATVTALIQFKSFVPVAKVLVLYLIINVLDEVLIQPMTIGRTVHLHPALLIGSIILGGTTLGFMGMIVAVPVVTILQETTKLLVKRRPVHAAAHGRDPRRTIPVQPYVC
jgi:predicted PurR-regulated permease PerM